MEVWSRSFGLRCATRYQDGLRNGAAVMSRASRQVLPRGKAQPIEDRVQPDPCNRASTCVDLGNTFHARPQVQVVFGQPSLDPEGVVSLLRYRNWRDLG